MPELRTEGPVVIIPPIFWRSRRALFGLLLTAGVLGGGISSAQPSEADPESPATITFTVEGISGAAKASTREWLQRQAERRLTWSMASLQAAESSFTQTVTTALQAFGYYSPEVQWTFTAPLQATVDINKGPPTRLTDLSISYLPALPEDLERPEFSMKTGDILQHQQYESARDALVNTLIQEGYVNASLINASVTVTPDSQAAKVAIEIAPGRRAYFGEVTFTGAQLKASLLERYIPFNPGDAFSYEKLIEFNRLLRDSRYFRQINIEPDFSDLSSVAIAVTLSEGQQTAFEAGAGFGTDSGVSVDAEYERRWINRSGHRITGRVEWATRRQLIGAGYEIPKDSSARDLWKVTALLSDEETDTADSRAARLALSRFHRSFGLDRVDSVELLREQSTIADVEQTTDLLLFSTAFNGAHNDSSPLPASGYAWSTEVTGALEDLYGDASLIQVRARGKWITSLSDSTRLLLRAAAGTTVTDDFDRLPASLRFFAGGDRSIRGYDFESLGPENADGDVIGGKHLLETSVELEQVVHGRWRVAGFVDAGGAFNDTDDDINIGAGVGLRYALPFGAIRLDIGVPVGSDTDADPRLHLVVGPDL